MNTRVAYAQRGFALMEQGFPLASAVEASVPRVIRNH